MSQSFISMYLSLYDIVRYIKTGITTITELDTALTEMRKVSDESTESLKRFQKASFDIAGTVGTTAKQIQNSTADWMRLGESLDEASKSAEVSNILLNVRFLTAPSMCSRFLALLDFAPFVIKKFIFVANIA